MTRFGMNVELAYPEGYELIPRLLTLPVRMPRKAGAVSYPTP